MAADAETKGGYARAQGEEERERDRSPLRTRLGEGLRFLWNHRFLRACAFLYAPTNFIGPGVLLAVGRVCARARARRRGRSAIRTA